MLPPGALARRCDFNAASLASPFSSKHGPNQIERRVWACGVRKPVGDVHLHGNRTQDAVLFKLTVLQTGG